MRPLLAWSLSAFTAVAIIALALVGVLDPRPMIEVRFHPDSLITIFGKLTSKSPPGQVFRCEGDRLHRIDVLFHCYQESDVTLRLRRDSSTGEVIQSVTISPEFDKPEEDVWVKFEFDPIEDSAGRDFHFSLEPSGEQEAKLSPWVRFHGQVGEDGQWGNDFLGAGAVHGGDFLSSHTNLRAMAFPVETLLPTEGEATLKIFDNPTSKEPLRAATSESSESVREGWAFFSFEPVPESRWKRYHFELRTPDHCRLIGLKDEQGKDVARYKTFHGLDDPDSPLLGMTRGASEQLDRDLIFRAWGDDPPSEVFSRLHERTEGKLLLAAILWCLATAICLRIFVFPGPTPEP